MDLKRILHPRTDRVCSRGRDVAGETGISVGVSNRRRVRCRLRRAEQPCLSRQLVREYDVQRTPRRPREDHRLG